MVEERLSVKPEQVLGRLDLNLLVAFDVLVEECNVTRAAERLSVGQPAMSASLSRLRRAFGDPLLVREGSTMRPTLLALEMVVPIRTALSLIESTIRSTREFDPHDDHRTFTLMASDYVLLTLFGPVLDELEAEAPHVRLNVRPTTSDALERLARSEIDVLIMPAELASGGVDFRSEPLFRERLVVAVAADHPDVGDELTMDQFLTLPYMSYDAGPSMTVGERRLADLGIDRPVDVYTQSFVIQPLMLPGTRLMALLHERLAEHFVPLIPIRLVEAPFELAPMTESMIWSPRTDADPAHRWLRERIRRAASSLTGDA